MRKSASSDGFQLESGDDDGLDMDEAVDDGFLARYRRENSAGHRLTDYHSLDADGDGEEQPTEVSRTDRFVQKRVDRQMAASAIDAVDRLFGAITSQDGSQRRFPSKAPQERLDDGSDKSRTRMMNREKWLADVRARAATKEDRATRNGKDADNSDTVDVDAVEDVSDEDLVEKDVSDEDLENDIGFEEAEIGDDGGGGKDGNGANGGISGEMPTGRDAQYVDLDESFPADSADEVDDENFEQVHSNYSDLVDSDNQTSFSSDAMFQNLMRIARRGPDGASVSRKRNVNALKSDRELISQSNTEDDDLGRSSDLRKESQSDGSYDYDRSVPSNPDVSHLLGLTKQIIANQKDRSTSSTKVDQDGNGNTSINDKADDELDRGRQGSYARRVHKYSFVRRVGSRAYRLYNEPEEWRPLSEEEVAKVRSDSKQLNGNAARGKGVVSDCRSCRATGLEPCIACLGSGWIPSLSNGNIVDEKRRTILEKMWNHPNLVVDCYGEAQCVRCNGIGKQFCSKCKGSGSANKKGFNVLDMRELFNIFPDADESLSDDEFKDDDIDDDNNVDVDDVDDFQFYTEAADAFNMHPKPSTEEVERETEVDEVESDVEVVDEDMDVEDESAELLAALEAMHVADLEEGGDEYADRIQRRGMAFDEDEVEKGNNLRDMDDENANILGDDDETAMLEEDGDEGNDLDEDEVDVESDDDLDDDEDDGFQLFLPDDSDDEDDYSEEFLDDGIGMFNGRNEKNNEFGKTGDSKSKRGRNYVENKQLD